MKQQNKRRCVIFAGGVIADSMQALVRAEDFIMAADAGVLAVERFGLSPDLCLGDWDSAPKPDTAAECITLPPEKDDTDTYHAARVAIARGFTEVLILGGLGGRLDHTLANISTLLFLRQSGVIATLAGEDAELTVLQNEERVFAQRPGFYFSLFPLGGDAAGVFIRGAKYPLENARLTTSFPVGVSNEILDQSAAVGVKTGAILVIYAR